MRSGGIELEGDDAARSEEHTSELQSRQYLVCRLLLEKKNTTRRRSHYHQTTIEASERTSSVVASPGRRPGPTTIAFCSWMRRRATRGTLFPSTTLFRARRLVRA